MGEGDLGGFIEKEENLSQEGSCWVYDDSCVVSRVVVLHDAQVSGNSTVGEDACVFGKVKYLIILLFLGVLKCYI